MSKQLLAFLLLASALGCRSPRPVDDPWPPEPERPSKFELVLADRNGDRHAKVEDASTNDRRRYLVVSTDPAQEDEPTWIFELVEPQIDLVWRGKTLEHPDRAVLAALQASLEQSPPDVENVVASLPRLVRYESRGTILARAAKLDALAPGQVDALLDAVLATNGGVVARTTSGREAGGGDGTARHDALVILAARADLGALRAQRIAASLSLLPSTSWRDEVLRPLVPLLTTETVLAATDALDRDERHDVIVRLTKERGDRRSEALKLASVLGTLPSTSWRNEILSRLVPVLTTPELVTLSDELDRDERHDLLVRLVKERGSKREEALLLLATCSSLPSTSWRDEIILRLAPVLTTPELIAASDLLDRDERHDLVIRLVKERGQNAQQAHLLCDAATSFPSTAWKNEVYLALFPVLTTKELLSLSDQLDRDERRELVLRLVKARGQDHAEARLLCEAATSFPSTAWKNEVYLALYSVLSTKELIALSDQLDRDERHDLIVRLVRDRGKNAEQAKLLTDASASFPSTAWKNEVYGALFPYIGTAALIELSQQLDRDESRDLSQRLATERGAEAADAELVAAVVPSLVASSWRLELLQVLIKKDAVSTTTLLARASDLDSDDRHTLLARVAKARRKDKAAADKIAAAATSLQTDGWKAEVLLELVGYASKDAIVTASHEIGDAQERSRVLEALLKKD